MLKVNGSASLTPDSVVLTAGEDGEYGSAWLPTPVSTLDDFSISFAFQAKPVPGRPLGAGLSFVIQNSYMYGYLETATNSNPGKGSLGMGQGKKVAIKFDFFNDNVNHWAGPGMADTKNATGLYVDDQMPGVSDPQEINTDLDFTQPIHVVISYNASTGTLTQEMGYVQGALSWKNVYPNVNLRNLFARADYDGGRAYVGFTGSTGSFYVLQSPPTAVIEVFGLSVKEPSQYRFSFTIDEPKTTAADVFSANGRRLRTLWQANRMLPGDYVVGWDGLDEFGKAVPASANPYVQMVESTRKVVASTVGNDGGYSAVGIYGIAASQHDDRLYTAIQGADSCGGGCSLQLDANGRIVQPAFMMNAPGFAGSAVAMDKKYLFVAVKVALTGGFGVTKITRDAYAPSDSFTGNSLLNFGGKTYINVYDGDYEDVSLVRKMAVTNYDDPTSGVLYVVNRRASRIERYDKVTGQPHGAPFAVQNPTAVAYCEARSVLFVSDGRTVFALNDAGERIGTTGVNFLDVSDLVVTDKLVYVADRGAGRVYAFGLTDSALKLTIGQDKDDGVRKFWNVTGLAVDAQGFVYTTQHLRKPDKPSTLANGVQIAKWSPSGANVWVRGGYSFQGGAGTAANGVLTTSDLRTFSIDNETRAWKYLGTIDYPDFDPTSDRDYNDSSRSPMRNLGGTLVKSLQDDGGVIFVRNGAVIASVSPDLIRRGNQQFQSSTGIPVAYMMADRAGNVWCVSRHPTTYVYGLYKLPLTTFDKSGAPIHSWNNVSKVMDFDSVPNSIAINDGAVYSLISDWTLSPPSSISVYGNYSIGGSNALVKYFQDGTRQWTIRLPNYAVCIDSIPGGGGVMVGMAVGSEIYQVTSDGQVTACSFPLVPSDWLDVRSGSIGVSRDEKTGCIDVFTENIGWSQTAWHSFFQVAPVGVSRGKAVKGAATPLK